MKAGARIETDRLLLRPWTERDRDLFFEINSDRRVMAFFPFRRDRTEADRFFDEILERQSRIPTFQAVELREAGECIGFCGLHQGGAEPVLPPDTIEIGWRLVARAWGNGYATESAQAWLRHGFEDLGLDKIVSFAVRDNHASIAVMKRIGMTPDPAFDFDHPRVSDTHPHLKRHVFYRLGRDDWQNKRAVI